MIVMEGLLLAPPERGTIIGRAVWKQRYVVLGTGSPLKLPNDQQSQTDNSGRGAAARKGLKAASSKSSQVDVSQPESQGLKLYITIYKAKGDYEFLQQIPLSSFKSCEVKTIQHRKQSPSLPTLILELKPDSVAEKQRKRRSSRTGGLTGSSKDANHNLLLFRTVADETHNIYDWQMNVKPSLTVEDVVEEGPMSPLSPVFNFSNPFANRDIRNASNSQRPDLQQRISHQSNHPQAPQARERPSAMISPSPSLRSRRSDLSSQASSHPPMGFTASHTQNYATLPTDLPSPVSTSGYGDQFIEGWTSAQGRSSALSSHTRGSNSIASAVAPPVVASTPPGPRETILDRAFQMRCIPGGDRVPEKDEEKISSIARFEALMREVDERKQAKALTKSPNNDAQDWGLEEESEESSDGEPDDEDELRMSDEDISMPTPAQRALDYISGRRTPLSSNRPLSPAPRSPPIPFLNSQAMSAFHGQSPGNSGLRPRAGTTSSRNGENRPGSVAFPSRSVSTNTLPTLHDIAAKSSSNQNLKATDTKEKRRSSASVKRLSFQEFAKRLSSTSSLLLVQTNASSSSGSRRVSNEFHADEGIAMRGGAGAASDASNRDKRCGWRGSVGVFGEGGFL